MLEAEDVVGLLAEHLLRVALAVVTDRQHQLAAFLPGPNQQGAVGVADGVGDDVGDHRAEQFLIEETHQVEAFHFTAGADLAALQHLIMAGQLGLEKILDLVITGAHGQLVDAELIQAEQLHQHAVEAGKLVLNHALLAGLLLFRRQLRLPLRMGAGEHSQGVFHVVHGGGDHRGEVQSSR